MRHTEVLAGDLDGIAPIQIEGWQGVFDGFIYSGIDPPPWDRDLRDSAFPRQPRHLRLDDHYRGLVFRNWHEAGLVVEFIHHEGPDPWNNDVDFGHLGDLIGAWG